MAIIPSTGVELVPEVGQVLQGAGGVVDVYYAPSYFAANAKINKWSKYKPTKYRNLVHATGNEDPKQWQADNGLCGFKDSSIVFNSAASLVAAYRADSTFVYELPTGDTTYPLRIADFREYYTEARSPIWSFDYTGQIYANNSSSSSTFKIMGNSSIDISHNLRLSDILPDTVSSLSTYYFGVIITNKSGSIITTVKSSSTIGASAGFVKEVTVKQTQIGSTGTYLAYPALIDDDGKEFVACPIGHVEFQVLASADAEKVGWMADSGKWAIGDRFTYQGRIGYSPSFEGVGVFIELLVNNVSLGNGQTVTLKKDSQSSDGKTYYMTYTRSIILADTGASYRLRMGYGSNMGNSAYLDLKEVSPEDIEP